MRPLTILEQLNHAKFIGKFVEQLESKILSHSDFKKFNINLKEVGYGVFVEDQYVYFDYPYNPETVPEFNYSLGNDDKLKDVDNYVHRKFFQLQKDSIINGKEYDGYIYYKYLHNTDNEQYVLINEQNNIGLDRTDPNYLKFLPIMDCAISPDKTSYKNDVIYIDESTPKKGLKEILILSKRVGREALSSKEIDYTDEDNTLLCTFELVTKDKIYQSEIARKLYEAVFFFLESYFQSPLLEKIILDKRKSYILGYKHNIGRLRPDVSIEIIRKYIAANHIAGIENQLLILDQIIKVYQFTHKLMFDFEFVQAGFTTYDVLFKGKSVSQIIEYFNLQFSNKSLDRINIKLNVDYTPKFDVNEGNYELFDFTLILWNVWRNAQIHHQGKGNIEIHSDENENGEILFKFINSGKLDSVFIDYINLVDKAYPLSYKSNNNPYPGLMIVKDLVKSNSNLGLKVYSEDNEVIFELIIK